MTFIDKFKSRATFYPAGRIVPQRIAKGSRKYKHNVTFIDNTWFIYTPKGWLIFAEAMHKRGVIHITARCKKLQIKNVTFVGTSGGRTIEELNKLLAKLYKEMFE